MIVGTKELARRLGVTTRTIENWVAAGVIKCRQPTARKRLFWLEAVLLQLGFPREAAYYVGEFSTPAARKDGDVSRETALLRALPGSHLAGHFPKSKNPSSLDSGTPAKSALLSRLTSSDQPPF